MMFSSLAQLVVSLAVVSVFPTDVSLMEASITDTAAAAPISTDQLLLLSEPQPQLPVAKSKARRPKRLNDQSIGIVTSAASVLVADRATGHVLFQKNPYQPRSIGSVTKLMTALVFLERVSSLDDAAQITDEDFRIGGRQHIQLNDEVRVRDLLEASLIASDNSATAALVRLSGLSLGQFVERMNERAGELGMEHTTFADATGLSPENRSTVFDLTRLLEATADQEMIRAATTTAQTSVVGESGRVYQLDNTNELLETFLHQEPFQILEGKTGFLPEAGYCLGAVVSHNGEKELMVIVLGGPTKQARFQDVKALSVWAYQTFSWDL